MKKRKQILCILVAIMMLGVLSTSATTAAKPIVFKLGHCDPKGSPNDQAAVLFSELINSKTNGAIVVEVYEAESLGSEKALVQGLKLGTVDFVISDCSYVASLFPTIGVFDCPYLYRDWEHYRAATRSEVFTEVAEAFEKATGIKALTLILYGRRHVISNKLFTTPEEAAGLLVRTPEAELSMDYARAVGGTPTPIAYGEAYLALRQGVADAAENPLTGIWDMKWYEVCKYVILTQHAYGTEIIGMSKAASARVSEEQMAMIQEAAQEVSDWVLDYHQRNEEDLKDKLREKGLEIVELPSLEPFTARALPYVEDKYKARWGEYFQRLRDYPSGK